MLIPCTRGYCKSFVKKPFAASEKLQGKVCHADCTMVMGESILSDELAKNGWRPNFVSIFVLCWKIRHSIHLYHPRRAVVAVQQGFPINLYKVSSFALILAGTIGSNAIVACLFTLWLLSCTYKLNSPNIIVRNFLTNYRPRILGSKASRKPSPR